MSAFFVPVFIRNLCVRLLGQIPQSSNMSKKPKMSRLLTPILYYARDIDSITVSVELRESAFFIKEPNHSKWKGKCTYFGAEAG